MRRPARSTALSKSRTFPRAAGSSSRSDPMLGRVLRVYRVVERVAEGGMAIIYRAEHLRLPRTVAIKVLKPELSRSRIVTERFLQEARAVNQIKHPSLVEVIDVEAEPSDPPLLYMVMEFLEGVDLAKHLRTAGALPPLEALQIADQLAEALIAAHAKRILHRDIKAENVFLARRKDGRTLVKLLDFGVAAQLDPAAGRRITTPGSRVGTPDCMAPEQLVGGKVDERTDVFGFGLLLYHMLNGAMPFRSTSLRSVPSDAFRRRPRPLARAKFHRAGVPLPLQRVVLRCLERRPGDRYPDMGTLRRAMWTALGGRQAAPAEGLTLSTEQAGNPIADQVRPPQDLAQAPIPPRSPRRVLLWTGVVASFVLPILAALLWVSRNVALPAARPLPLPPSVMRELPVQTEPPGGGAARPDARSRAGRGPGSALAYGLAGASRAPPLAGAPGDGPKKTRAARRRPR